MTEKAVWIGDTPSIGVRLRHDGQTLWFGLISAGGDRAIFSGIVDDDWPEALRRLADEIESMTKEKST